MKSHEFKPFNDYRLDCRRCGCYTSTDEFGQVYYLKQKDGKFTINVSDDCDEELLMDVLGS